MRIVLTAAVVSASLAVAHAAPEIDVSTRSDSTPLAPERVRAVVERLPLAFEANRGQAPSGWDFLARCRGYHAFVASTGVVFSFDGARLDMSIAGAATIAPTTRGLELPGKANYFLGDDPSKWISNVPLARGARYADVASGTSWSVGGRGRALEFAFDLAPGADAPRLVFDGARGVRVDADGALRVAMPTGEARISAPVAWQDVGGGRLAVRAAFVVETGGAVRVVTSPRDVDLPVHVDPTVTYATYLGAALSDVVGGAAMDGSGAAYLTGSTTSAGFPTTGGAYDLSKADDGSATIRSDAFVTKLAADGASLVYSTFVGSTSDEDIRGIAVDASGAAYFSGDTYTTNYPTTSGTYAPTSTYTGGGTGVLTKLAPDGASLAYSTYTQYRSWSMALGSGGTAYVLEGGGLSLYSAGATSQVFYRQIDPLTTIGNQTMSVIAVCADAAGDAYVTGYTSKTNYPLTAGAYQTSVAGQTDMFVTKINSSGQVVYATLCGGSAGEQTYSVGVNWSGQAFVCGVTYSTNYPVTSGAYRTTRATSSDSFLTRFNATGTALKSSTYLGGSGTVAASVRVHPSGACVVCGQTYDSAFPTSNAFQSTIGGATDGFVLKFNPDNTLAWSSFYGGTNDEGLWKAGMGPDGSVVLEGQTTAGGAPLTSPYQQSVIGSYDLLVVKIPDTLPTTLTLPVIGVMTLPDWTVGVAYLRPIVPGGGLAPCAFTVTSGTVPPGLTLASNGTLSGTPTQTGNFTFNVTVVDVAEKTASGSVTIRINEQPTVSTGTLQGWTVDVPVDQPLPTSGGTPPLTYALVSSVAPPGTTLGANGRLTGTPTTLGTTTFMVSVTDSTSASNQRLVSFRVNSAPTVKAATLKQCTETMPYSFQLGTTDGTAPFVWAIASGVAPAPLGATTGLLSGTTAAAGPYSFTARATDAAGVVAERAFTVTVNPLPQVTTESLPVAAVGRPFAAQFENSGGTAPFTWDFTYGQIPVGVRLEGATGALSGIPTEALTNLLVMRVTDACGATATRPLTFETAEQSDLSKKTSNTVIEFAPGAQSHTMRFVELTEGAVLGIAFRHAAKGTSPPSVVLTDSAGVAIDLAAWTKTTPRAVVVRGFVVPASGRYFVTASVGQGFVGKAKLTVTVAPRKSWPSHAVVDPAAPVEFAFTAPPGALLTIKARTSKGGAALPHVASVTAPDGTDLVAGGKLVEKGAVATFTLKTPLAGGVYRVVFAARDAGVGDVSWTVKLRLAKLYTFALPDLTAGE